ncbi:hypothetical protein ACHAQH_005145 [Verticillium albo-atrum]
MRHTAFLVGLAGLTTASPLAARQVSYPEKSKSLGFTLVVNVTDPASDFCESINHYTLSSIHVGAGQALAAISTDSARVWYLNGTQQEISESQGTVVTDGGTPPFPNGIDIAEAEDSVSAVRVDAGDGTKGVQLANFPDPYTYLTAPLAGSYLVCNESVPYYQGRKFLLLKHAETEVDEDGEIESNVPEDCVAVRLLPQCADLEDLPEGAIASHAFANEVGCYDNVTSIEWNVSWATIPTDLLLAELTRRKDDGDKTKPQCGSGKRGSYDLALHIGALVLILSLSTISCGIPLLPRRSSGGRLQKRILFYCQHFGTGVLLATAFVHLLPTAFLSLTDPCLPSFFNEGFPPMAGFIAMVAALTVVALESYLATRGAGHSHSHHYGQFWDEDDDTAPIVPKDNFPANGNTDGLAARREGSHRPSDIAFHDTEATDGLMAGASPLQIGGSAHPTASGPSFKLDRPEEDDEEDSDIDLDMHELDAVPMNGLRSRRKPQTPTTPNTPHVVTPEEQARLLRQCVMLEGGILFHSVFIGMAISVATGSTFIVFLIAISFHQTFEGLALGSRIAAIQLPRQSARPWLMVLAFGATTPFGQLIGLVVHKMYDPMSQTGLLMVGFMNSISAGLLLFAGLVQLLSEDFLTEKSYHTLTGKKRWRAYASVVGGAALMALVGGFA